MQNDLLLDIQEKVFSGERVDRAAALRLMESNDILAIGKMADFVRKKKNGDNAYFTSNLNVNYTNICESRCPLCAFSKDKGDRAAYVMTLDEIEEKVRKVHASGLREVHIVGGLWDGIEFSYYEEMLRRIKKIAPEIHIQGFTAVEIDFFGGKYNMKTAEVLGRLKMAGLGSIPGGGAEIFAQRVRDVICPKKISGKRWLEVMEAAHALGIRSNATMLYGHIETSEERIDHMLALRELQDKTGGFLAFVPLAFHPDNTDLTINANGTTGFDDIKVIAVSRIVLDNFPHIKSLWMYFGLKMVQTALSFGADDIGGVSLEEKIVHAAGAKTPAAAESDELSRIIRETGRTPKEVDSVYREREREVETV